MAILRSAAWAATRTRLWRWTSCGGRRRPLSTNWSATCAARIARKVGATVQAQPPGGTPGHQDFCQRPAVALVAWGTIDAANACTGSGDRRPHGAHCRRRLVRSVVCGRPAYDQHQAVVDGFLTEAPLRS